MTHLLKRAQGEEGPGDSQMSMSFLSGHGQHAVGWRGLKFLREVGGAGGTHLGDNGVGVSGK